MSAAVIKQYKYHAKGQKTQVTGWLWSDGKFRKNVTVYEHQLREPKAWCIDANVIQDLLKRQAKSIRLYDKKNDVTWIISPAYFIKNCGELDRGDGKQYFCPLKYWQSVNKHKWQPVAIKEPKATQPELM